MMKKMLVLCLLAFSLVGCGKGARGNAPTTGGGTDSGIVIEEVSDETTAAEETDAAEQDVGSGDFYCHLYPLTAQNDTDYDYYLMFTHAGEMTDNGFVSYAIRTDNVTINYESGEQSHPKDNNLLHINSDDWSFDAEILRVRAGAAFKSVTLTVNGNVIVPESEFVTEKPEFIGNWDPDDWNALVLYDSMQFDADGTFFIMRRADHSIEQASTHDHWILSVPVTIFGEMTVEDLCQYANEHMCFDKMKDGASLLDAEYEPFDFSAADPVVVTYAELEEQFPNEAAEITVDEKYASNCMYLVYDYNHGNDFVYQHVFWSIEMPNGRIEHLQYLK